MKILKDFPGANIDIVNILEKEVLLRTDVRDSFDWWFHWAFAVEDALGEMTFQFTDGDTIGYRGPAVSYDGVTWNWLGSNSRIDSHTFQYDFKSKERVYFAFSMLYQVNDFERFYQALDKSNCRREVLTKSRMGKDVPLIKIGAENAENHIILTARHHACESTGSYVLQGILSELAKNPIPDYLVSAIPFIDIDGVENGDQGKNRAPHDHNRDYIENPIYPETKALMEYAKKLNVKIVIDLHSPGNWGGCNDYIGFIKKFKESEQQALKDFSILLEKVTANDHLQFYERHNYDNFWMTEEIERITCVGNLNLKPSVALSASLETPYSGIDDQIITQENMLEFGKAIAIALKKYIDQ